MTDFTPMPQEMYKRFDYMVNNITAKLERSPYDTYSEDVHRCYIIQKMCSAEIARKYDVTKNAILAHLRKMGVPRKSSGGRNYWKVTDEIRNTILQQPHTDAFYAKHFGLHKATVYKIRHDEMKRRKKANDNA